MNNRNLIIALVALLAIFLITKLSGPNKSRSFAENIISVDTSKVDRIVIHSKTEGDSGFSISKTGDEWTLSSGDFSIPASRTAVNSILYQISSIKAQRLVAKSKQKWADYEVDEEKGGRVEVFDGSKKLEDFVVGRLYFNQQSRAATSYIRKTDEEDTYAVEGFLNMNINRDINSYRVKELVNLNSSDINSMDLTNSQGSVNFSVLNNYWSLDNTVAIDSASMASYINRVSRVRGSDFYDENTAGLTSPVKILEIKANNTINPVKIDCFIHPEEPGSFVIHSSENIHNYFTSDSTGIFKSIFTDLEALTPE